MPSIWRNVDAEEDLRNFFVEPHIAELFAANVVAERLCQKNQVVLRPGERIVARAEPAGGRVDHLHFQLWADRANQKMGEVGLAEKHHFFKRDDCVVVLENC